MRAASAGVAMPPAAKFTTGRRPSARILSTSFERRAVFLGEVGDFLFGQGAQGADFAEDHAAVAHGFDDVAGSGLALGTDHGSALGDAAQGFPEVAGSAYERHGVVALVDMEAVVGGGQHFAFCRCSRRRGIR